MYITAGYTISFVSEFASYTSTIVHALLFYHRHMYKTLRNTLNPKRRGRINDLHYRLMAKYPEVKSFQLYFDSLGPTMVVYFDVYC
jgi:hypothetical protein